jgi:hypothetical protein
MTASRSWKSRRPEIALLLLGVALRLAALINVDPMWGYDADGHLEYAQWFTKHWTPPPVDAFFHAFHMPLYYAVCGLILRAGGHVGALRFLSIVLGSARLGLLWLGLELYLPGRRLARLWALTLAAVLPVALFTDVTLGGEVLQNLLSVIALLLAPRMLRAQGGARWRVAGTLGLVLGLCVLTKISAMTLFAAIGLALLVQVVFEGRTLGERLRLAAPFALTLAVAFALLAPVLVRNVRGAGTPFPSSFDTSEAKQMDALKDKPVVDRRSIGYVFLWSREIYRRPYTPAGIEPQPRFFPVLLASTFGDYLNYESPRREERPGDTMVNSRPLGRERLIPWRLSVLGGTAIALASFCCWLACLQVLWERREAVRLPLLLAPPLAIAALLHFTIAHPFDYLGVIKSAYVQVGCAPVYGLFGLAVDSLWSRGRGGRVLAGVALAGLGLVTFYTFFCRLHPLPR